MKILFCKIASMKYYKGVCDEDKPYNGGSFVEENGYGHEEYNFRPVIIDDEELLLGFVETKSTAKGKSNELHIEKIPGCEAFKNEDSVDGVLVIWCATTNLNETSVVGWYKDAIVHRNYWEFEDEFGEIQYFNIEARKENCVLLPKGERHRHIWNAPLARKNKFGFGQALIWYAQDERGKIFIDRLVENINEYEDENWVDVSVLV